MAVYKPKSQSDKEYYQRNKERLIAYQHEYNDKNKQKIKSRQKEYTARNKERKKAYNLVNKERIRENHTKWCAKQRKENPMYRLHDNLTSLIGLSLKNGKNGRRTEDVLGYSIDILRKHLEKQFWDGMSWENYGEWHIDHIVPLRAFNIKTVNDIDFKRAWVISNLQPLWAKDNLVKNGKLIRPFQPSLALAI